MKTLQQHRARTQRWLATLTVAAIALSAPLASAAPAFADVATPDAIATAPAEQQTAEPAAEPVAPVVEETVAPVAEAPAEAVAEAPAEDVAAAAPVATAPVVSELERAVSAVVATPTVSVTEAPRAGGVVTVSGSGFAASKPGIYVGVGVAGLPGFYLGSGSLVASETTFVAPGNVLGSGAQGKTAPLEADGTFSFTVTVPAYTDVKPSFAIYTSKAHGQGMSDKSQDSTTLVQYAPIPAPSVTVSKTTGINADGETITVKGTGFVAGDGTAGTRPPLAGKFGGSYVVFGRFADVWKPSEGAPSASRVVASQNWAVNAADMASIGGPAAGAIEIKADGTFEATLQVSEDFAKNPGTGNYGIYTYSGSGAKAAQFETYTPITFAPKVVTPTVTVSKTTGLDAKGETVTVTGAGFLPTKETTGARPPLAGKFTGAYVVFGRFADAWQPSKGAASSTRAGSADVKWGVHAADMATIGGAPAGAIEIKADGTFETTLTVTEEFAKNPGTGNYGIYTYPGGGAKYAPYESYTPITFAAAKPPVVVPPVVTPPAVQSGSLSWGVSSSFRAYITGIAQGSFGVSNGATSSSGSFNFGQSGGNFNAATSTGSANYSGSVRFTGHGGVLDLTFSNPTVRVNNASNATLELSVNGSRVDFASINLAAASRSTVNGATVFSGAPVLLSPAGSVAFEGFYSAGTPLDSLSFTIGSAGAAPSGSTGTIATASVTKKSTTPVPATPPATQGLTLTPEALAAITAGGDVAFEADGFQPNETGIRVVIYSTPTVLAENLTADANGVVRWSGKLPATLTGKHTLTVQGSISKGIVVTIPERTITGYCTVKAATLDWGFKQGFIAYLTGGIANGTAAVSGGASEANGLFHWADGTGTIDPKTNAGLITFAGGIRFTGHEGVLDTTIANPRIELVSATEGYLVLDVSGTTQQGEPIAQQGVRFASLALDAGSPTVTDTGIAGDSIKAELTDAGAAAFGTYPAGEALDPISFVLPTDAACGTAVDEVVAADTETTKNDVAVEATAATATDVSWIVWVLAGALAAALVVIVVLLTKRRRAGAGASAK